MQSAPPQSRFHTLALLDAASPLCAHMKKIRAKFAITWMTVTDAGGNRVAEKPGILPSAVGPSRIPAEHEFSAPDCYIQS